MIDLHAHTTASDGSFTPSELAAEAKRTGLEACAITDHDTVAGVEKFLEECGRWGVEGIPGVELSAKYATQMHIVGLYIDYKDERFLEQLYILEHSRKIRNKKMLERCREYGFDITEEELVSQKDGDCMDSIGRPHFANLLVKKGYARDNNEAFRRFLKKGNPCYVERQTYPPKETIEMIKKAGGAAVLAHPIFISKDRDTLTALLRELKSFGLDAAECRYSEYDDEFTEMISEICDELGLLKSGGSDFHGTNKPDISLGTGMGSLSVPYEWLTAIRNCAKPFKP